MVTDRIIEELEKGIVPWHKPWSGASLADGGAINYVSRKPYSILNQMLLGRAGEYLTFKQVKDRKGNIKKGAKSSMVVFFTMVNPDKKGGQGENGDEADATDTKGYVIPILRYYRVFHIDDCEGIESKIETKELVENDNEPIEAAEGIINGYLGREQKLKFHNDNLSDKAYYSLIFDEVVIPKLSQFEEAEEYYSTAFHELTHSTMPAYRCDRKAENANSFFGNEDYSKEELVAEIGSAMLCNYTGIDSQKAFHNSVGYIQAWLKSLKNDNKMIVWAASRAEKAARYIIGEKE